MPHSVKRLFQIFICGVAVTAAGGLAHGKQPKGRARALCESVLRKAEEAQQALHLLEAHKLLKRCAQPACGSSLQQQCALRATQLNADIPSIVPLATDQDGKALVEVKVTIGGVVLTDRLDGRALQVDPGEHELTFDAGLGVSTREKVVVAQGQRNRKVAVTLTSGEKQAAADKLPPASEEQAAAAGAKDGADAEKPVSGDAEQPPSRKKAGGQSWAGPYVLGSAGLIAVGGFFVLTNWGRQDTRNLSRCTPDCPPATLEHIDRLYQAANISLGVGAAALVSAAAWLWLGSGSSDDDSGTRHAQRVNLQLLPAGGIATWGGTF